MQYALKQAGIVAALTFASWGAQAADHTLALTGMAANPSIASFDVDATHFDISTWSLQGLDSINTLQLSQGDTVTATITFDAPLTVPASVQLTFYTFTLRGADFPVTPVQTEGTADFTLGGLAVASYGTNCGTSQQLASCWLTTPPGNGITFDQAIITSTITALDSTSTADSATFSYSLWSPAAPVPEPAAAGLLVAGLAALGLRRRQRS